MPRAFPEAMQLPKNGEKNEKQLKHSNAFLIRDMNNSPFCPPSLSFLETVPTYSTSHFPSSTHIPCFFSYWPHFFHFLWQRYFSPCTQLMYTNEALMYIGWRPLQRKTCWCLSLGTPPPPQKAGGFSLTQILFSSAHDQSTELNNFLDLQAILFSHPPQTQGK